MFGGFLKAMCYMFLLVSKGVEGIDYLCFEQGCRFCLYIWRILL